MKSKEDYIKGLSKVKLIIGNGFDLHCHMKTSYKDFFLHDEKKNELCKILIDKFNIFMKDYWEYNSSTFIHNCDIFDDIVINNIWDFFFYLNSNNNNNNLNQKEWRWCDIEDTMLKWLMDREKNQIDSGKPYWERVYNIINNNVTSYDIKLCFLATAIYIKHNRKRFDNINDFYIFLLGELKVFEMNFGSYIDGLHFDRTNESFGVILPKTSFRHYSAITIKELCNFNNLSSIDSFNYDSLENADFDSKLININGNHEAPIFGIDSDAFPASDIRYIFSKTNRRMELDMLNDEERKNEPYENVVIYGHSLNKADYSYFFAVFDKLQISDLTNNSKIIFAFSIYDDAKEQKIRSEFRSAVSKMFYDYSIYLGKEKQPNRLLDVLTSQGKILMYEISEISTLY